MAKGGAMWGGRFGSGPDALFRAINDSLAIDWRLVEQDLDGSIAWAQALVGARVLSHDEADRIVAGLGEVREEARGLGGPPVESGAEDVHTWVEQRLIERIGTLGKKLHTGRSRNDQVATDLRLWTWRAIGGLIGLIEDAQRSLVALADREAETIMPGYTHLQRAQPVLVGHWCLAYVEMLARDAARLGDTNKRVNICPLGCAALAGTAFKVDREAIAAALGFDAPTANSLDGVADRDFVLETLDALVQCALHLSKLGEELVLFASGEFGLVEVGDAFASGSSLMPQKKNPDALELLRGKAGVIAGQREALTMILKSLPLAYNKDLQEDKAALFRGVDELGLCLRIVAGVVATLEFDRERCLAAARAGHSNATDLADALVERGVAFREAHEIVGSLVREAIARGVALEELDLQTLQAGSALIDESVVESLTPERGMARRTAIGGSSPVRVREAIDGWMSRLGMPVG